MTSSKVFCLSIIIFSYVMLLGRQVIYGEFSDCYDDVNICLWTNGSDMTQSDAQTACQQRSSILPHITNNNIQSKLAEFRSSASPNHLLGGSGFWIDVKQGDEGNIHWIDGSSFAAGGVVHDQTSSGNPWCAVTAYVNGQFVYSARRWSNQSSSYICQVRQQGASCDAGDLSLHSKCYKKFDVQMSWFNASNDCVSRSGSLAVFSDIGRPSQNSNLTAWLDTDKTYWIGLVRFWWKTAGEEYMQYSNWESGHPNTNHKCVIVKGGNYWNTINCNIAQRFVCQNSTYPTTTTTSTTTSSSSASSTTMSGQSGNGPTPSSTTTPLSSTKMSSASDQPETNKPPVGLIVGVTVGVIVGVLIIVAIVVLVVLLLRRRQGKTTRGSRDTTPNEKGVIYADIARQTDVVNNGVSNATQDQPVVYSILTRPNGNV